MSKIDNEIKNDTLLPLGVKFTRTYLGDAVFIHTGETDAHYGLFPSNWTVAQLRAIADFMENNPNCTIFSDGSGNPCR